jgi:hypothetical protein
MRRRDFVKAIVGSALNGREYKERGRLVVAFPDDPARATASQRDTHIAHGNFIHEGGASDVNLVGNVTWSGAKVAQKFWCGTAGWIGVAATPRATRLVGTDLSPRKF